MYNGYMLPRTLAAILLTFLPLGALAAQTVPAADLGPQTSAPAGGSNADAGALQPAGLSPIQSTTTDSAGLTAPANALQAPAIPADQLQVLAGEADGAPQEFDDTEDNNLWIWDALAALVLVLGAAGFVWRDRQRFRQTEPSPDNSSN